MTKVVRVSRPQHATTVSGIINIRCHTQIKTRAKIYTKVNNAMAPEGTVGPDLHIEYNTPYPTVT
jgi:hypothetical protein